TTEVGLRTLMAISFAGEALSNSRIAARISLLECALYLNNRSSVLTWSMFFLLIQVITNSSSREGHFHQTGCEGFLAVTVRAGGNVQKLRPEISTSVISDLRNSSA